MDKKIYRYNLPILKILGNLENYEVNICCEGTSQSVSDELYKNFDNLEKDKKICLVNDGNKEVLNALSLILRPRDLMDEDGIDFFKNIRKNRKKLLYKEVNAIISKDEEPTLPYSYLIYAVLLYKYDDKIYNFNLADSELLTGKSNILYNDLYTTLIGILDKKA